MQVQVVVGGVAVLLDQQLRVDLGQDVLRPEDQRGEVFAGQHVHVGLQKLLVRGVMLLSRRCKVHTIIDYQFLCQGQVVVESVLLDLVPWEDLSGHFLCIVIYFQ